MRGRGCVFALALATSAQAAQSFETPSGQQVTLEEVLLDENPGELWARFRFLAPDLRRAGDVDPQAALDDMQHLCDAIAAPYLVERDIAPARIVISLSDKIVPFGETDPSAMQVFEMFRPEDASCIWEEF